MNTLQKIFVIILVLFTCTNAQALAPNVKIQGIALIKIKAKNVDLELEQITILNEHNASFTALDDFGGVVFTVSFLKDKLIFANQGNVNEVSGKKIKSLLSLPLTQDQFLSILRYELPIGFSKTTDQLSHTETWRHPKQKKLSIELSNFTKTAKGPYPKRILMTYKKSLFDLKWQKVEFGS